MSGFSEFDRHDGVALAQLVRDRDVSAEELLEALQADVIVKELVASAQPEGRLR